MSGNEGEIGIPNQAFELGPNEGIQMNVPIYEDVEVEVQNNTINMDVEANNNNVEDGASQAIQASSDNLNPQENMFLYR